MEIGKTRLALTASALAMALMLAGCGGGGSSSTGGPPNTPSTPPVNPMVEKTPAELATTASGLLDTAEDAVKKVMDDSDEATVTAAGTAVDNAVTAVAAASEADNHATLANRLGQIQGSLTAKETSRTVAMNAAAEQMREKMAAAGKALYSKLNYSPTMVPVTVADGKISIGDGTNSVGDESANNGTGLAKQEATIAPLNGWMGTDYMKSTGTGDAMVTHKARVYSNPDAPKSTLFTDRSNPSGLDYDTTNKAYDVAAVMSSSDIVIPTLPTSGAETYKDGASVEGSYKGAGGTYKCIGGDCTAAPGTSGSVTLTSANWHFVPDAGASIMEPDSAYLQFGWWVRQDKDGEPTHASAFYGIVGSGSTVTALTTGATLTGTATYNGKAAGKFAVNNPLGSDSNGGHFTANAMLNAKFGTTTDADTNGLTGTIDSFRLNDGNADPGWSVSLNRARWNSDSDKYQLTTMGDASTADDHIIDGSKAAAVEWSIGGVAQPGQTGQWEAQLFNEISDNSNTSPTTVLGRFEAGFGDTHKMVGAFSATK